MPDRAGLLVTKLAQKLPGANLVVEFFSLPGSDQQTGKKCGKFCAKPEMSKFHQQSFLNQKIKQGCRAKKATSQRPQRFCATNENQKTIFTCT
jgi:hypothetical protein